MDAFIIRWINVDGQQEFQSHSRRETLSFIGDLLENGHSFKVENFSN